MCMCIHVCMYVDVPVCTFSCDSVRIFEDLCNHIYTLSVLYVYVHMYICMRVHLMCSNDTCLLFIHLYICICAHPYRYNLQHTAAHCSMHLTSILLSESATLCNEALFDTLQSSAMQCNTLQRSASSP